MSQPFYVAPEQVMKDRADYARKGIARGRGLASIRFDDGIVIVAENPSETLRKVSEIYDRIAFAGVGRYNEFDQLRVAGIRAADLKGFQYSRDDVDARTLANQYAQILGNIFTHEMKPMEVEILVAEIGTDESGDQMFHIVYDGTVFDRTRHRSAWRRERSGGGASQSRLCRRHGSGGRRPPGGERPGRRRPSTRTIGFGSCHAHSRSEPPVFRASLRRCCNRNPRRVTRGAWHVSLRVVVSGHARHRPQLRLGRIRRRLVGW